ncbi:hypothetical protein N7478_000311 [Penicillium angulare]|uniref:uncharacterized protein n=1 Tax=Penicillium angulare TaxID=116970 RepID=UPI00253FBF28|nr:uncharacterized protein N7478_000311 [Penicillium angulare]KAJ5291060.1 hypothetical protein N7478_000311 [Penicillium angulare]
MITYRQAQLSDLDQILAINAHYILHTSLTFMRTSPHIGTYVDKWRDLQARGLPYLVAVEDTNTKELDVVLGYASFSPFRGHLLSYAPTVELSLFVHPDYQSRSIGSGLLNELFNLVRNGKVHHVVEESGPRDMIGYDDSESTGDNIQVRNIIAVMAVDPEGKDGGEELRKWYTRRGFVEKGRLEKVGFKRGHWIDTVYLQYSTS